MGPANFTAPGNSSAVTLYEVASPFKSTHYRVILTVTRESASWKFCVLEGAFWNGTAEENTDEKYGSIADL
jgi:hypothetical protein